MCFSSKERSTAKALDLGHWNDCRMFFQIFVAFKFTFRFPKVCNGAILEMYHFLLKCFLLYFYQQQLD